MLPFQVPRHYRHWLFDPGSLTKRLILLSNGDFKVKVLRQYRGPLQANEQHLLNRSSRSIGFIREVVLLCEGRPWVFAKTLIPTTTLNAGGQLLTQLGNKPLGAVLFSHPHIKRDTMVYKKVTVHDSSSHQQAATQAIWGRLSTFNLKNQPLLVSEYFLPECPMYNTGYPAID